MPNWCFNTITLNSDEVLTKEQKNFIELVKKNIELDESRPMCDAIRPMPKELIDTTSPTRMIETLIEDEELISILEKQPKKYGSFGDVDYDGRVFYAKGGGEEADKWFEKTYTKEALELQDKYGFDNWYDWSCANLGTKWGDCQTQVSDDVITYDTAWAPLLPSIINEIAKLFPNMHYSYQEEQGWGEEMEFYNGEVVSSREWDAPYYIEIDETYELFDDLSDRYKEILLNSPYAIMFSNGEQIDCGENVPRGFAIDYVVADDLFNTLEELLDYIEEEAMENKALNDEFESRKDEIVEFIHSKVDELKASNSYSLISSALKSSKEYEKFSNYKLIHSLTPSFDDVKFDLPF